MIPPQQRDFAALLLKRLLLGCAFALLAFCLPAAAEEDDPEHTGKVFSPVQYSISLEYAGSIEEVLIATGDTVQTGQVLARYRLKDEAALNILAYLNLRQTILDTQIKIASTEKEALTVKEEYEEARRLSAAGMGSAERLRRLQNTLDLVQRQKALLVQNMEIDKKNLQIREEIVKRKLGKPVEGTDVPEYGELLSLLEGEVVYIHPLLRKGAIHDGISPAVTVARTNPMEVRTRVFEAEIPDLRIGGKVKVKVLSLDGRAYDGVIASIDRNPEDPSVDKPSYYWVRIEIPNDDGKLRAGFKTTVAFVPETGTP